VILLGIGGNLPSHRFGEPMATCAAALAALGDAGVHVVRRSRWYRSDPVPASAQPPFVNGVAEIATDAGPGPLLAVLHRIENDLGRVRGERNGPRVVDLDLLAYHATVCDGSDGVHLPHPRLHERAFVLVPLAEIAPEWRHPVLGIGAEVLLRHLPPGQIVEPLEQAQPGQARRQQP